MLKKPKYKTLQFDFSTAAISQLDKMVKSTGSYNRAELFREALRFYSYLLKMLRKGYVFEFKRGKDSITIDTI